MIHLSVSDSLTIAIFFIGGCFAIYKYCKGNREKRKIRELEEKRRKLSILPRFEIINLKQSLNYLDFELINKGSNAKNIRLTDFDDCTAYSAFSAMPYKYLQFLGTNETVHLHFTAKENPPKIANIEDSLLHTKICFEDIESNSYYQTINERVSFIDIFKSCKLSEPSELK